jgi:hypothetical protein
VDELEGDGTLACARIAYRPKKLLEAHKNPMVQSIQPIGFSGRRETMIVPTADDVTAHIASGSKMIRLPCSLISSERTENTTVNVHNDQASPAEKRALIAVLFSPVSAATKRRALVAPSHVPP